MAGASKTTIGIFTHQSGQEKRHLGFRLLAELSARCTQRRVRNRPSARQDVFADRKTYAGLMFVAKERKMRVEDVGCGFGIA